MKSVVGGPYLFHVALMNAVTGPGEDVDIEILFAFGVGLLVCTSRLLVLLYDDCCHIHGPVTLMRTESKRSVQQSVARTRSVQTES